MQLLTLLFGFIFIRLAAGKAVPPAATEASKEPKIHRLLQVFGVSEPNPHRNLQPPPQYMLDLYKSVADDTGMARGPNPHNSKVIRSFADKGSRQRFLFNISGLAPEETVLEAELHVYLMSTGLQPHVVYVYQVTDADAEPKKSRLIDSRYVSGSAEGWQVFRVRSAVDQWMSGQDPVYGLRLVAETALGEPVAVKIARHGSRHPVLILFNDDASQPSESTADGEESSHSRHRRDLVPLSAAKNRTHYPLECHRQELYVDFESIGWSEWIIAPKGYNAYHCSGVCTFPLGQSQKPTNHATVQSIIHEMKLADGVARPCCVPSRLLSLSLLYYDENDNVVLKQYGDMVADSCGCH